MKLVLDTEKGSTTAGVLHGEQVLPAAGRWQKYLAEAFTLAEAFDVNFDQLPLQVVH